jgi:LDH2 family malate/lactate/ureidoglycolate dehydrogenase
MKISGLQLRALAETRLLEAGFPASVAATISEHLARNDEVGRHAHGIFRLPGILRSGATANTLTFTALRPAVLACDAPNVQGIAALDHALRSAAEVAKEMGTCFVRLTGYKSTTGGLGLHAHSTASKGFIVLIGCSSEEAIAQPGSTVAIFGTNPTAFAVAAEGRSLVFDAAASVKSYGDLMIGALSDDIPPSTLLDADGNPSTDPDTVPLGLLVPFGGHKGIGHAAIVEALSAIGNEQDSHVDGAFAFVIDPATFGTSANAGLFHLLSALFALSGEGHRMPGARYSSRNAFATIPPVVVQDLRRQGILLE